MFLLLFFFSSCKKEICICADDRFSYCPDNIQTFYYPLSSNANIIQSLSQDETEIHAFLSSTINDFVFDFDLTKQSNLNITFESLNIIGLLTVKVHFNDEIQSISLNPKEQITIRDFIHSKHLKNNQKRINYEDPDFFRDKTFTEDDISDSIIIDSKSSIREISNCNFSILSNSMKTLFTVQTAVEFEGITFDIDFVIAIIVENQCAIRNCVFNHIGSGSTAILINPSVSTSVFIENCIFNEQNTGNFVFVDNQSPNLTLYFLNCSLLNKNSQTNTRFLYSISEDVTIDSCSFVQPAGSISQMQAIRIYLTSSSIGSFSFINNDVFNAINRFIGLYLYQTPIFANNTFHDFNRNRSYFMDVTLSWPLNSFLFENNTYRNIVGGADYNGGIATWVQSSSRTNQITIEFIHCTFINVTNIYPGRNLIPLEYRCQGGVFQHGFSPSISNSSLIFNSCIFNDNSINGCGGALAFEILGDLAIINCSFISNKAKLNSQVVGCLSNGGAIFLANSSSINSQSPRSVTIQNCNFIGNEATEGSVFYYYPDSIEVDVEVIFESCTFQNNGRIGQSQIVCYSPSFMFFDNTVQYTSDSEIGPSNEYSIILPSAKMIDISHCYFFNQNELNATGGGFLQVSQQSNSMVYDNCFNLHDLVFNSSKHYSSIQLFLPQLYSFSSNNVTICNYEYNTPFCTIQMSNEANVGGSIINLNNWSFYNCKTSNNTGVSLYTSQRITFTSCSWYNNSVSNGNGGAFHIYNLDVSFINCQFIENSAYNGGALAISNVLNTIYITNCTFSSNQATQNGGAIYFFISRSSDNNKTITISNCTFSGCRSNSGGALYINSAIEVLLEGVNRFECCSATQYGSILVLQSKTTFFDLPSTTIIENQTDGSQFLIYCYLPHFRCYNLNLTNNITQNCFYIYGDNGYTELKSIHFENVAQAIYICNIAENTEVLDCTFYNCHPSSTDSIVSISSIFNVLFSNNTFDSIKDGRPTPALYIQYYSQNIEISHNRFLNCDSYQPLWPAIRFAGSIHFLVPYYLFKFNYNYLKNVGSNKLGVFLFNLNNQQIEFCHNEMDGCINLNANDTGYLCGIELIPDTGFEFNNFTLRRCQSYATYGGSLGLWATSTSSNPIMSFFNCHFINNFRRSTINDQGGGGFQLGTGANSYFELVFTSCEFIGNSAYRGGGLSISTRRPLTIHNCVFLNNSCTIYGGAIYLNPNAQNAATLMEKCTIYNCTFEQNYALENLSMSSVIFIERNANIHDTFIEIESCNFIDNANIYSTSGYIIHSEAPLLSITNSTIEYSNITERSIGFLSVNSGTNTIRDITIIRSAGMSNVYGLSVFLDTGTTSTFDNCTFIECGNRIGSFTIHDNSDNCIINNCNFTYHPTDDSMKSSAIDITSSTVHTITNTFISNAKGSGPLLFLDYNNVNSSTFENLTFINNQAAIGGGSGIVITGITNEILFTNCQFIDNELIGESGGAICFNYEDPNIAPLIITFRQCLFENNHARNKNGGAISINSIKTSLNVDRCSFNSNSINNDEIPDKGGAIYIEKAISVVINECYFIKLNSNNGCAIYYKKTENAKNRLIVRKSQFIDCESAETGKKLIFTDSVKVTLEDIDVTYSDEDTV